MENTENKTDNVTIFRSGLTNMYDLGIDHAITIVNNSFGHIQCKDDNLRKSLLDEINSIIKKLEELKGK